jgi:hypothetical protein
MTDEKRLDAKAIIDNFIRTGATVAEALLEIEAAAAVCVSAVGDTELALDYCANLKEFHGKLSTKAANAYLM